VKNQSYYAPQQKPLPLREDGRGLFPLGEDLGEAYPPLKGEGNGAENKMAYKSPLPLLSEGRGAKGIFVYVLLLSS